MQILEIARGMGLLKPGSVSLDGTKVKANASRHSVLSYEYALKLEEQLKTEVAELLKKAESADQVPEGMNIPEELTRRGERLKAIAEARAEIERRAIEQAACEKKIEERARKEKETGRKTGGSAAKLPVPGPTGKDQANLTDGESRIMPSQGSFEQAYNAQAVVDTESLLIIAEHVSQNVNDKLELTP